MKKDGFLHYKRVIDRLSEGQMRQLLFLLAQADPHIWELIEFVVQAPLPEEEKQRWVLDLRALENNAKDRYGFIDYDAAYSYCCALMEYLDDRVPNLLEDRHTMEAFELVCLVFDTAVTQEMDDSAGGLSMIGATCMHEWEEVLERASLEQQKEMFRWFCAEYQTGDMAQMFLCEYMFEAAWKPEIVPGLLDFLDEQIKQCENDKRGEYYLGELVLYRAHWMEQTGASSSASWAYLQNYRHLSDIRKFEIEQAEQEDDWPHMIALLKESKQLDADKPGLLSRYSRQLIDIYERLSERDALREELEYYLFTFRQVDLEYTEKLKALLPDAEWSEMRERLLQSRTMLYQEHLFLYQEGLFDRLMEYIEERMDLRVLEQYEEVLLGQFPQRCTAVYEHRLALAMRNASDRKAYRTAVHMLSKLKNYPDGEAKARKIAQGWKMTYPRRKSMLDELAKAGF